MGKFKGTNQSIAIGISLIFAILTFIWIIFSVNSHKSKLSFIDKTPSPTKSSFTAPSSPKPIFTDPWATKALKEVEEGYMEMLEKRSW